MAKLVLSAALILILSGSGSYALAQDSLQSEIRLLKAQVAAQQEQINELRHLIGARRDPATPMAPTGPLDALPEAPPIQALPEAANDPQVATTMQLGSISFTPTGFFDTVRFVFLNGYQRIPNELHSIPFNNTVEGKRKHTVASAANTRLGLQVNTNGFGVRLLGTVEPIFLGTNQATSPPPRFVWHATSSRFHRRSQGKWEFLGGQDWSLLTPGRKGIAPLPSGLMLTQDLDPNNQSGLVWTRSPQARVVYRPSDQVALGASFDPASHMQADPAEPALSLCHLLLRRTTSTKSLPVAADSPFPVRTLISSPRSPSIQKARKRHAIEMAGLINRFAFYIRSLATASPPVEAGSRSTRRPTSPGD